jgi:hypothetical protein
MGSLEHEYFSLGFRLFSVSAARYRRQRPPRCVNQRSRSKGNESYWEDPMRRVVAAAVDENMWEDQLSHKLGFPLILPLDIAALSCHRHSQVHHQ